MGGSWRGVWAGLWESTTSQLQIMAIKRCFHYTRVVYASIDIRLIDSSIDLRLIVPAHVSWDASINHQYPLK